MVQIQIKQKQEVVAVEDVSQPASYATLKIWERVDRRKMSLVKGLMCVGTALLTVMLVSRMVWALKQDQVGLDGSIQMLEIVPSGLGHEIDLTVTCTYATGAASWTKDCSCYDIFYCGCVLEVTQCMKGGGCANICFEKQEQQEIA
eukprot:GFUD01092598.1.p1 GENE.GFUD01092598.1~~GFUD01092598.1.p1  ORF type:complete len:164 (-),score=50.08 GFUD01092598.1:138-575(-)